MVRLGATRASSGGPSADPKQQRGHHQNSPSAAGSADLAFAAEPLLVNCQCGSISFRTPTAQYLDLFHCHCTECQKQSATAYGTSAIYTAEGLFPLSRELKSRLRVYTRATDSGGSMDCYFCSTCGSRLFHRIIDEDGMPKETVSIKGGCIKGLDWTGGKHIYTRSAVVEVPKECEQYDTFPDMSRQVEKNK